MKIREIRLAVSKTIKLDNGQYIKVGCDLNGDVEDGETFEDAKAHLQEEMLTMLDESYRLHTRNHYQ